MKRLFFLLMIVLWGAFIALAVASPETLDAAWRWAGRLPWPLEVVVWIVFLPWMLGLAVWHTDWSHTARLTIVAVLAVGWSAASFPRNR